MSKIKKPAQSSRLFVWSLTMPQATEAQALAFKTFLHSLNPKDFVFQLEEGEKKGKPHFQGYLKLKEKLRKMPLLEKFKAEGYGAVSLQPCSLAGKIALQSYAMKKETRKAGPWGLRKIYTGHDLIKVLRPWQKAIETMLLSADVHPRQIHWYYDEVGGAGKSSFSKYMYFHHKILTLTFADSRDLLNLVFKMPGLNAYLFDLSRTKGGKTSMSDIYQALESIKNGYFINSKYDTGVTMMATPHVAVFSNHLPDLDVMSKDRWVIHDMSKMSLYDQVSAAAQVPTAPGPQPLQAKDRTSISSSDLLGLSGAYDLSDTKFTSWVNK